MVESESDKTAPDSVAAMSSDTGENVVDDCTDGVRVMLLDADGSDAEVAFGHIDVAAIGDNQLMWIDVASHPDDERVASVLTDLGVTRQMLPHVLQPIGRARLDEYGTILHLELTGLRAAAGRFSRVSLNCIVGVGWLVTSHAEPVEFLDEFRARIAGGSDLGDLDAPSLLATLLEWQLGTFHDAIDDVVAGIDRIDEATLEAGGDVDATMRQIRDLRHRIADLRRTLAPHQQVYAQLARPELDQISTSESAAAFRSLNDRVAAAIDAIDSAREMLIGSFDMVMTATAQRTNDIMRVLTIVSVALLPSTVIAGVLGMNFNPGFLGNANLFWVVLALMSVLMATPVVIARRHGWL